MTDKPTIYDQHERAFRHVGAHVVLKDGEPVAKIAFKFPRDGAGRLYAYVHVPGSRMQRHHAGGYGYDKSSPAVRGALHKIDASDAPDVAELVADLQATVKDEGWYWYQDLERAGYRVFTVI